MLRFDFPASNFLLWLKELLSFHVAEPIESESANITLEWSWVWTLKWLVRLRDGSGLTQISLSVDVEAWSDSNHEHKCSCLFKRVSNWLDFTFTYSVKTSLSFSSNKAPNSHRKPIKGRCWFKWAFVTSAELVLWVALGNSGHAYIAVSCIRHNSNTSNE